MKVKMDQEEVRQGTMRFHLIQKLEQIDEHTREARADRELEVNQQRIIGSTHFAHASTECINLYRDGHFIATVMTTQAVNEGIMKFVADRNCIKYENMKLRDLLESLKCKGIISQTCFEASKQIWGSYRNDVHHMNPKVAKIPFQSLAKKNIQNLAVVEREIWENFDDDGRTVPIQPKYWDINPDGTGPVYLRMGM